MAVDNALDPAPGFTDPDVTVLVLDRDDTGFVSCIRVATHGSGEPWAEYFATERCCAGRPDLVATIAPGPTILERSTPDAVAPDVAARLLRWIALNEAALRRFWLEADTVPIRLILSELRKL